MKIKRIAITGPESTGKSMLAEKLALHYKTAWVPEFAREYLDQLSRQYRYDDILEIAKGQLRNEKLMVKDTGRYLFCDTELIVTKIWCEVKYGKCHPWIIEHIERHPYDLYLLCNIDLPWEDDPLREHPNKREYLFNLYLNELKGRNLPYKIISGQGDNRIAEAINIIEQSF